jgi:hypothetical protein
VQSINKWGYQGAGSFQIGGRWFVAASVYHDGTYNGKVDLFRWSGRRLSPYQTVTGSGAGSSITPFVSGGRQFLFKISSYNGATASHLVWPDLWYFDFASQTFVEHTSHGYPASDNGKAVAIFQVNGTTYFTSSGASDGFGGTAVVAPVYSWGPK